VDRAGTNRPAVPHFVAQTWAGRLTHCVGVCATCGKDGQVCPRRAADLDAWLCTAHAFERAGWRQDITTTSTRAAEPAAATTKGPTAAVAGTVRRVRRRGRSCRLAAPLTAPGLSTRGPGRWGSRTYSRNDKATSEGPPLLFTAGDELPDDHDARSFQVPTSMRDVEPSVPVWLRFKQLDERG
jgi:hypothetical protein